MRALSALVIASAVTLAAPARADDAPPRDGIGAIARRGVFALSIENVFGIAHENVYSREGFTQLGLSPSALGPRLGFFGVMRSGFTIGGLVSSMALQTRGDVEYGVLAIGPRVGWTFMSPRGIGVQPRVGLTTILPFDDNDAEEPVVNVGAEVPLLIRVTDHVAITIGPSIERTVLSDRRRANFSSLAFTAGLLGAF